MSLGKKRKVTELDIDDLHARGNVYGNIQGYTVINIQPIYYTLDDDRKLIAPVGMTSTRIGGNISYILARNDFIKTVDEAAHAAGVAETEYVASPLAEELFLFDDYKRDNCVMLADCGRLGTTLFIGRGDGICRQYYFPWGGENITAALAKAFEIRRAEAERLKRKVILSLDPKYVAQNDDDCIMQTEYAVDFENETHMYPVDQVNETVRAELDRFVKYVAKTLKVCDYDYPKIIPLSLTGGGVNHIRGAAEYISAALGKDVETVCPELPLMERPQLSSALGLIDMVLCGSAENETLLSRFKRWIGRR